ncbi:DUF6443 domain-containing protein [Aquimarina sp. 2201CG14-23]|uniref:DUF6443 domain-containing protein n=1 Tax=Aquimarina mycalae TaxID=3040073 RepID=UPI002477F1A3|nr:DUF6443 domain-containing protein [Aquimarina sp. 2201CG14-23]
MLLFCSATIQAQADFVGPTTVEPNTQATYRISKPVQINGQVYVLGGYVVSETEVETDIYDITIQWENPANGVGYIEAEVNVAYEGQQTISLDVVINNNVPDEIVLRGPINVNTNDIVVYEMNVIADINGHDITGGSVLGIEPVPNRNVTEITIKWDNPSIDGKGVIDIELDATNQAGRINIRLDVNINVSTDFTLQGPTTVNQYQFKRYNVQKSVYVPVSNWSVTGGEIVNAKEDYIDVVWIDRNGGKVIYDLEGTIKTLDVIVNSPTPNNSPFTIVGPDIIDPNTYAKFTVENNVGIQYPEVNIKKIVGGTLEYQEQEPIFYVKWPDTPYGTKGVIIATIDSQYTIYKEVTINITPPYVKIIGKEAVELGQKELYYIDSNIPDLTSRNWEITGGEIMHKGLNLFVNWNKAGVGTIKATATAPNGDVFTDQIPVIITIPNLGKPGLLGPVVANINSTVKYELKNAHDAISSYQNVNWNVVGGQVLEKDQFGAIIKWNHLVNGEHSISVSATDVDGTAQSCTTKVTLETKNLDNYINPPSSFSTNENYILTQTFDKPIKNLSQANEANTIENIAYFDVLGRPKQELAIKAGGNQEDIIHHMEYDGLGRQTKTYLRYASETSNKAFRIYAQEETKRFYDTPKYEHTQNPYAEIIFENNPSPRIQKQFAPGDDWKSTTLNDHAVYAMQDVVRTNDNVRKFSVVSDADKNLSLQFNGYVETGITNYTGKLKKVSLQKNVTRNENWKPSDGKDNTIEEYMDYQGRVVLKRLFNKGEPYGTYYVYDDHGSLIYVIPPKASDGIVKSDESIAADILNELCYQYRYDSRYRMIEKKVPGKGWEYMVYDRLDRLILTQDARQMKQVPKEWVFTKYDKLGRVVYTGILYDSKDRETMQSFYDDSTAPLYEERVESPLNLGGTGYKLYYSNNAEPKNVYNLMSINYYDDYHFDLAGATNPINVYDQSITANTKTLATGSKIRVLGTKKWITNVNYYSEKAQLIYGYTYNEYLGTTNTISNKLDFTSKVLESKTTHKRFEATPIVTLDKFTYDHVGRLLTQKQTINNQPEELIVSNTYDELGMLIKKNVGGQTGQVIQSLYAGMENVDVSEQGEITKNHRVEGWNAGTATRDRISGDGKLSFLALQNDKAIMVGLSYNNIDNKHTTINYAMYLRLDGKIGVYEKGVNKGVFSDYTTTDELTIERKDTTVYYQKNGITFYTSTVASNGALMGDVCMYHNTSGVKNFRVSGELKQGLQTVDYTYNVRGWLRQINNPDQQLTDDLFAFKINYNNTDVAGSTALYNGNISETHWKTANDGVKRHYTYSYDALSRITKGIDNTGRYNLTDVSYDKNGNLLNLTRQGWQNGVSYANMDRLHYTYDQGNRLMKVIDTGNDNYGFKDGVNTQGIDYEYDVNGNMTVDRNKGITNITYNHLNLPTVVTINGKQIRYTYDATGTKLTKSVNGVYTHYDGSYVYEGQELQFFKHPEGYIEPNTNDGFDYIYQYRDHIDNIRLSYSDTNKDGIVTKDEIRKENNYYPFGLKHEGYNNVVRSRNHKYGFGGKEEQDELGLDWIDITVRNYDPALGRWMNIDLLAEIMRRHSPYNYAFNNPIFFTDPDGMAPRGWISLPGAVDMRDQYRSGFNANGYDNGSGESTNNGPDPMNCINCDPKTIRSITSTRLGEEASNGKGTGWSISVTYVEQKRMTQANQHGLMVGKVVVFDPNLGKTLINESVRIAIDGNGEIHSAIYTKATKRVDENGKLIKGSESFQGYLGKISNGHLVLDNGKKIELDSELNNSISEAMTYNSDNPGSFAVQKAKEAQSLGDFILGIIGIKNETVSSYGVLRGLTDPEIQRALQGVQLHHTFINSSRFYENKRVIKQ